MNTLDSIRFREGSRPYTYKEIGDLLGLSAAEVRRIERAALMKLLARHGRTLRDLLDGFTTISS